MPGAAEVLARAGGENFTVASRLLPGRTQRDLMALYGFARLVDQLGDDVSGDRRALLDELERDLDRAYGGAPRHELMRRLAPTIRAHAIPPDPFRRLIEANRRDQDVHRYETFDELLDYCRLSANPVGELVLYVFDAATPERVALSDSVCSGLQVIEHVQDVAEDLRRGRVYMPAADMRRLGVDESALAQPHASAAVRDLIAFEVARAERLLAGGAPLGRTLRGRARFAICAFVAGGLAACEAVRRAECDFLGAPPRASKALRARLLARTLRRTRR
jgi:squalene synthase HpnC